MTTNPRIVREDVTFEWDGGPARYVRGQIVDIPPDSELEAAVGKDNLEPLFREPARAPEPPPDAATDEGGPRKARSKQQDDSDDKGDE